MPGQTAMVLTHDGGETWATGNSVTRRGLTQTTTVGGPDGPLVAHFRERSRAHRKKRSESHDNLLIWSEVTAAQLPNPDGGIEALMPRSGHLAMACNDAESGRYRLAVTISDELGRTWKWKRCLESTAGGRFDYPSLIQSADGTLYANYSYTLQIIQHVHFTAEWVQREDQ